MKTFLDTSYYLGALVGRCCVLVLGTEIGGSGVVVKVAATYDAMLIGRGLMR